jgi:esterase
MALLHSNIVGTGQPLYILHGFLGMGDNWKSLANQFAEIGYQVHLIDQRNHGRSFHSDQFSYTLMAEDLMAYTQEKNLDQVAIIGHSMGGKTAMLFATTFPERVSKLIVVDIAPRAYPQHHQDILKGLSSLDFSTIQKRSDADDQLKTYVSNWGVRQFLLKNLYRTTSQTYALRMNLPILKAKIEEVGKALPEQAIFHGATLFLRGEDSDYIGSEDIQFGIAQHFPQAQVITIPESGHWIHAENPTEFFKTTSDFLKK